MGLLQKSSDVIPGLTRDPLISPNIGDCALNLIQGRNDEQVFCNSPIRLYMIIYVIPSVLSTVASAKVEVEGSYRNKRNLACFCKMLRQAKAMTKCFNGELFL